MQYREHNSQFSHTCEKCWTEMVLVKDRVISSHDLRGFRLRLRLLFLGLAATEQCNVKVWQKEAV